MLRNSLNPGQRSSIIDPLRVYTAAENGNKWENGSMTLYDRNRTPAAYIDSDGEHIYLFDGKPAAYLNEDAGIWF